MARITVEDCLQKVPNRFELIILAAKRARQLFKGARPLLETDNGEIVTALREIAEAKVRPANPEPSKQIPAREVGFAPATFAALESISV